ncbi:Actin-related protein 8 [Larimichthys crocea]|uniref:Uncharacterized protein n=1 Tax=Larimichthys crocea TaxID=215358 RepID=A0ACD3RBJ3_LARCR|nr:Actin-related protein 8 [Larimichthys crocea]
MTQAEKEQDNGKEKEKERDKEKEKEQQRGVKRPIAPPTIPDPLQEQIQSNFVIVIHPWFKDTPHWPSDRHSSSDNPTCDSTQTQAKWTAQT